MVELTFIWAYELQRLDRELEVGSTTSGGGDEDTQAGIISRLGLHTLNKSTALGGG